MSDMSEPITLTDTIPIHFLGMSVVDLENWLKEYQMIRHPSSQPSVVYVPQPGSHQELLYRVLDCWICFEVTVVEPRELTITKIEMVKSPARWKDHFEELVATVRQLGQSAKVGEGESGKQALPSRHKDSGHYSYPRSKQREGETRMDFIEEDESRQAREMRRATPEEVALARASSHMPPHPPIRGDDVIDAMVLDLWRKMNLDTEVFGILKKREYRKTAPIAYEFKRHEEGKWAIYTISIDGREAGCILMAPDELSRLGWQWEELPSKEKPEDPLYLSSHFNILCWWLKRLLESGEFLALPYLGESARLPPRCGLVVATSVALVPPPTTEVVTTSQKRQCPED